MGCIINAGLHIYIYAQLFHLNLYLLYFYLPISYYMNINLVECTSSLYIFSQYPVGGGSIVYGIPYPIRFRLTLIQAFSDPVQAQAPNLTKSQQGS